MFSCVKKKIEVFVLVVCYAAYYGICLPTFRDSVSLPPSRLEQSPGRIIYISLFQVSGGTKSAKYKRRCRPLSQNLMHPDMSSAFDMRLAFIKAMTSNRPRYDYPPCNKNARSLHVSKHFTEQNKVMWLTRWSVALHSRSKCHIFKYYSTWGRKILEILRC